LIGSPLTSAEASLLGVGSAKPDPNRLERISDNGDSGGGGAGTESKDASSTPAAAVAAGAPGGAASRMPAPTIAAPATPVVT
jgi:hypothetical protein